MNPAYSGGFEILAAGRPDIVILQYTPARKDYDGFPGYPIHPLNKQIQAIELISDKTVVAISITYENFEGAEIPGAFETINKETALPTFDVLLNGADGIVSVIKKYRKFL